MNHRVSRREHKITRYSVTRRHIPPASVLLGTSRKRDSKNKDKQKRTAEKRKQQKETQEEERNIEKAGMAERRRVREQGRTARRNKRDANKSWHGTQGQQDENRAGKRQKSSVTISNSCS
jgi:hypothetical protein